ncbi:protein pelota [Anabrus simplex]|uniref:protein pelota n=1 Tax=Anabrus simplex TaxID=316456 RepID=UPI0035A2F900
MKLVTKSIDKKGEGSVSLIAENPEDMWHVFNLVREGDSVRASTLRKVQNKTITGASCSFRARTTLTVRVETIDFDTQVCMLRLKGRNITENQYVKLGAYHTLDLELNRTFMIIKSEWDSISLDRIETACDPTQSAEVAAIVMQEGLANICLITANMTLVRAKITENIPRKRYSVQQHEKGLEHFFETVMQGVIRHVNFDIVKCILIASPGFIRDTFYEYMFQQAMKLDNKELLDNRNKFLRVHCSSGFKHSLKEILIDPAVVGKVNDIKASSEVEALEAFYRMLEDEPAKAFYGTRHVVKANEAEAIETLLISDTLFRVQDVELRKKYVSLAESVKELGGTVKLFSSMHISGEQLNQLSGIAAILRFALPELEDESDVED